VECVSEGNTQHRKEDTRFYVKTQIGKKPRGGGKESTIIHWLQNLQRLYARTLVLDLTGSKKIPQKSQSVILIGGECLFILDQICVHEGG